MIGELTIPAVFLGGLISFLSPCVLPLMPPYLCYLAGSSLDELTGEGEMPPGVYRRIIIASLLFVAGFTTVFIFLGASASVIGQVLVGNLEWLAKVAGVIIIIMGLHFLGLFKIALLYREARYQGQIKTGTYGGAYVMGLAFALGWTPCIGPVLAAILFVAASQDTVGQGMFLLAVYSLGIGLPFVLAALGAKTFMRFMGRFKKHIGTVEKTMGGLLVVTGILFITGSMNEFSFWLLQKFPVLGTIG